MTEYTASEAAAKISDCLGGRAVAVEMIQRIGLKYRLCYSIGGRRYYSDWEVDSICGHLQAIDRSGLFSGDEI